jgi:hypothetical protein
MLISNKDLLEIIGQDLALARAKFNRFHRTLAKTIGSTLDSCDDRLAYWLGKTIKRNKKPRKGRDSD